MVVDLTVKSLLVDKEIMVTLDLGFVFCVPPLPLTFTSMSSPE
jgi:hypothetical protein